MKIYTLKSGKKIAFSAFPRPREGDVVFFSPMEWTYIREQRFSEAHKDFLWEQKARDFRYEIVPTNDLTEPGKAAKRFGDILNILKKGGGDA